MCVRHADCAVHIQQTMPNPMVLKLDSSAKVTEVEIWAIVWRWRPLEKERLSIFCFSLCAFSTSAAAGRYWNTAFNDAGRVEAQGHGACAMYNETRRCQWFAEGRCHGCIQDWLQPFQVRHGLSRACTGTTACSSYWSHVGEEWRLTSCKQLCCGAISFAGGLL